MIRLIKNELTKIFSIKYIIISLLFILTAFLVVYYNRNNNSLEILETSLSIIPFLGMILCFLTGGIMSNEFQNGTSRVYFTKPVKRWKILLSKLLTNYYLVFYYLFLIILSYLLFEFFFLSISDFNISSFIEKYFLYSIPLFFISTFSLFLSTITTSTAFSVGFSCFIYIMGGIMAQILFGINIKIIQYTFLPYLDFTIFSNNEELEIMNKELGINLSQNNGIIILLVSIIVLYLISNYVFNKKDIKN